MAEESCGAGGGGARVGAHAAKLRDRAHGLGLLGREAGLDGDARMVDLHHLAGLPPAVAVAPAPGVAGDHAPGGGLAGREAVLARQHGADLGAPPQREAKARLAHQLELGGGPPALPHPARAAAAVGQGADALLAQAPLPAAERRPGAAGCLQGGRFGRALEAQLAEQRETVEALGGLRRKFAGFSHAIAHLPGAVSGLPAGSGKWGCRQGFEAGQAEDSGIGRVRRQGGALRNADLADPKAIQALLNRSSRISGRFSEQRRFASATVARSTELVGPCPVRIRPPPSPKAASRMKRFLFSMARRPGSIRAAASHRRCRARRAPRGRAGCETPGGCSRT